MQASPPADWPGRQDSRFIEAGGLRWHVRVVGRGRDVLLIHGTGASGHSWYPVAEELRGRVDSLRLIIPDLPGQGFSELSRPTFSSLPGMTRALAALLRELDADPVLLAGHSAGAAVAGSLCLMGLCNPRHLVSVNGAMIPFGGAAAPVFSRAARVLASLPVFQQLVALHAVPRKPVERMLRGTGSALSPDMVRCYRQLLGSTRHVAGTLRMMANWDLAQLERNLDRLEPQLWLYCGDRDQVLPPAQAEELARRLPDAHLRIAPKLGHLAHEEAPEWFASEIAAHLA